MLSRFDYVRPRNLEDALTYLEKNTGTSILAGGTDLMVMLRRNAQMPEHILDIKSIAETKLLKYTPSQGLFIGASVTANQVAESEVIRQKYLSLAQAADLLASYQLRNRATLVGNICNASPGADFSAPLLVYEANVHIANSQGRRIVAIEDFFTGVKKTVLKPQDMVIGVSLADVHDGDASIFLRQARIKGHDLGIVGVAARLTADRAIRLAMSAVAPTPIRLRQLEQMIGSKPLTPELAAWAGGEARQLIRPISDVRSSAEYRLHVSGVLIKRALLQLAAAGGEQHV